MSYQTFSERLNYYLDRIGARPLGGGRSRDLIERMRPFVADTDWNISVHAVNKWLKEDQEPKSHELKLAMQAALGVEHEELFYNVRNLAELDATISEKLDDYLAVNASFKDFIAGNTRQQYITKIKHAAISRAMAEKCQAVDLVSSEFVVSVMHTTIKHQMSDTALIQAIFDAVGKELNIKSVDDVVPLSKPAFFSIVMRTYQHAMQAYSKRTAARKTACEFIDSDFIKTQLKTV